MNKNLIKQISKYEDSFYIYNEDEIINNIEKLKGNINNCKFLYSMKANPNRNVLSTIINQGLGIDAASSNEVSIGFDMGLARNKIYYSAPGKTKADIINSMNKSIIIADSESEIELIDIVSKQAGVITEIGIRVNPSFNFYGMEGGWSKFGVDEDKLMALLKSNRYKNVKFIGIHVHLKSQELNYVSIYNYYKNIIELVNRVDTYINLNFINFGSCIGINYSGLEQDLDINKLGVMVSELFKSLGKRYINTDIFVESGRYIMCKSGIYVSKILDKKVSHDKTILIIANTLNGFMRPCITQLVNGISDKELDDTFEPLYTCNNSVQFEGISMEKRKTRTEVVTIMGNLCTSQDIVAYDIEFPILEKNDLIVMNNAGSYGAVLSPNQFAMLGKPKEFFLGRNGVVI